MRPAGLMLRRALPVKSLLKEAFGYRKYIMIFDG